LNAVYGAPRAAQAPSGHRHITRRFATLVTAGLLGLAAAGVQAQAIPLPLSGAQADLLTEARDALKARDRKRLQAASLQAQASQHPLAPWVAYWDYGLRLTELGQQDLEDFYARFPGTYVEDRLRNDWLSSRLTQLSEAERDQIAQAAPALLKLLSLDA